MQRYFCNSKYAWAIMTNYLRFSSTNICIIYFHWSKILPARWVQWVYSEWDWPGAWFYSLYCAVTICTVHCGVLSRIDQYKELFWNEIQRGPYCIGLLIFVSPRIVLYCIDQLWIVTKLYWNCIVFFILKSNYQYSHNH